MSAYRFVRVKDVLTLHVGPLEVARVVGMDTTGPELQWRDRKGRWVGQTSIDDRHARSYLREFAELTIWIRRQVRMEGP